MEGKRQALPALTGVRFFAALAVVLAHLCVTWRPDAGLGRLTQNGYFGVNLFFVLSGFILTYNYCGSDGRFRGSVGAYLLGRIGRIYPAYLLAFLLASPFVLGHGFPHLAQTALANLTMTQNWFYNDQWCWNVPAWSLSVEATFYVLFPLLLLPLTRLRSRHLALLAATLWIGAMWYAGNHSPWHGFEYFEYPPLRMQEFVIGMAAALLYPRVPVRWLRACAIVAPLGWLTAYLILPVTLEPYTDMGLLDPLIVLLIWGLAAGYGPIAAFLTRPRLQVLGEASYGVYILHWPLWSWFDRLVAVPPAGTRWWLPYAAVYLALLIGVSVLTYDHIEKPARTRIRSLVRQRRQASAAAYQAA